MSEKTRGVVRILLNSILSSFKQRPKPKLIGEDYLGTKFYEEPKEPGRKTQGRFFEPLDKENFEQELPAEWEAWLRYRRQEPPTKEEIEVNYRMILTKRENAANLKIEYAVKSEEEALEGNDSSQHSNTAFPTYEEYTTSPTKTWEPKK